MAEMKIMNVLTKAETIARAQTLADIFAQATGTQNNKISLDQARNLAEALKKSGYQLAFSLQPGQL